MAKKLPGSCTGSRRKAIGFSPRDGDIVIRRVSRGSILPLLGIGVSAGSLATLFTRRAVPVPSRAGSGSGGGTERYRDVKLGDRSDYAVYADFNDLELDARDVNDHFNVRSADTSTTNDCD